MKKLAMFFFYLLFSISAAWAEPPVGQVIEYHRNLMGMNVHVTGGDAIDQLNRQLLAQRYPNTVRLSRLTNYFQALYMSAMHSTNLSDVNRAYEELGRVNTMALGTEGVNSAAGDWTRPRLEGVRQHQQNLQAQENARVENERIRVENEQARVSYFQTIRSMPMPSNSNPCRGCSDHQGCQNRWARQQATQESGGNRHCGCRDPNCNNGWVAGRIQALMRGTQHFVPPPQPQPRPQVIPVVQQVTPPPTTVTEPTIVEAPPTPVVVQTPTTPVRGRDRERGLEPGQRHRTPSPGLERSFPELVLVPILQRALLPVSETIIEIGTAIAEYRDQYDYPRIRTPYEEGATQEMSTEALRIRQEVQDGRTLYRLGTRFDPRNPDAEPVSNTGPGSQFWGLRNPATFEGYGETHAMPTRNFQEANFIERATMREGADFIVRRIEPFTDEITGIRYPGGEYEVVVPRNSVQMEGHHPL